VEFRLLYEGKLRPSANRGHALETHEIRKKFHPQLRRLWKISPNLRTMAENIGLGESQKSGPLRKLSMDEYFDLGIISIGNKKRTKAGYNLVPLVTSDMALRCSLDILLLRPQENKNRYIYSQGDIDGQLKTLFDALRRPTNRNETGGSDPQDGENPLFCLLEDDRLISEVRVNSDELLVLPDRKELEANDAFVVIHVKLNHKDARTFGNVFGS
jgi:hypothetical protein